MKGKEKIFIVVLLIVLVVVIVIYGNLKKNKEENNDTNPNAQTMIEAQNYIVTTEDGEKINGSVKVGETKKFKDLEIQEISLKEGADKLTTIMGIAKNTTSKSISTQIINFVFFDELGNEIAKVPVVIGDIEPKGTVKIRAMTDNNFIDKVYDFKIEE